MIGPSSFRIDIGYDEAGLLVTVSHLPTNQQQSARPLPGETCHRVQDRLQWQLMETFFKLEDFHFEVGRIEVAGKFGGFYRVQHAPSKRSKTLDTITSPHVKNPQQAVLESFLEELWRDGLLPLNSGA